MRLSLGFVTNAGRRERRYRETLYAALFLLKSYKQMG